MRNILTISMMLLLLGNNPVNAGENKITTVDEALGVICSTDLQIGLSVFGIRDEGKSKEFQENAMATFRNLRQKRIMAFSINDAYLHTNLSKKVYAFYRMGVCYQQMIGKNIPQSLSTEMVSKLKKCEKFTSNKEQYSCAEDVASEYSK